MGIIDLKHQGSIFGITFVGASIKIKISYEALVSEHLSGFLMYGCCKILNTNTIIESYFLILFLSYAPFAYYIFKLLYRKGAHINVYLVFFS